MTINTLADYAAALKQQIIFQKANSAVTAQRWFSVSKVCTGSPPVFSTVSSSTAGTVPVAGNTGFPSLSGFSGVGRLSSLSVCSSVDCRLMFYDRLYHCGPYNTSGENTTLSAQPSFSSRVPGGTDYTGLQLWLESNSVSGTGPPVVTVTYTDESNNAGASTSLSVPSLGGTNGSCVQFPLASGDSGLRKIETVTSTVSGSGTFNLFVARQLALIRVRANIPRLIPMELLGLSEVFNDSALACMVISDSSSSGVMEFVAEIASR